MTTSSPSHFPLNVVVKTGSPPPGLGLAGHPPAAAESDKHLGPQPPEENEVSSRRPSCPSSTPAPS
eukprot:6159018-Pyramimonas_sp.AAC.1